MAEFTYSGIDAQGRRVNGTLSAGQKHDAVKQLAGASIKPILLELKSSAVQASGTTHELDNFYPSEAKRPWFSWMSQKAGEVTFPLLKNLLVLIRSGLSLGDALKLLRSRLQDHRQQALCDVLWKHISEGDSLAHAMKACPGYFDASLCNLVAVGEESGNLSVVLQRITSHMEENNRMKKEMLNHLAYPAFIILMVMVVVIIFLYVLLPRIEDMLNTLGGEMNLCASILISCSRILIYVGPILTLGTVIGGFGLRKWYTTVQGKRLCDYLLLKTPVLRSLQLHSIVYKTTNLLGVLLDSGINTTEALKLTEKTINNIHMREKFTKARRMIHEGISLSQAFKTVFFLPTLALDLITIGENTGNISEALKDITAVYREAVTTKLKQLTAAISSLALIFAFCLVGLIAASILLSVLQVSHTLSAG